MYLAESSHTKLIQPAYMFRLVLKIVKKKSILYQRSLHSQFGQDNAQYLKVRSCTRLIRKTCKDNEK